MIEKICEGCGISFFVENTAKKRKRKYCTRSCGSKHVQQDPIEKARRCAIMKEVAMRPEVREHHSNKMKEYYENNPEEREKSSKRFKEMWQNPEYAKSMSISISKGNTEDVRKKRSEKQKEVQSRPEVKELNSNFHKEYQNTQENKEYRRKISEEKWQEQEYRDKTTKSMKIAQNRPEVKELISIFQKEYQNRPEVKEKISIFQKQYQNRPDVKEHKSLQMIEYWSNPDNMDKHFKSSLKYKEYVLPSSKIVKIQGYEPKMLTELLKIYSENDIIIGVKEINKEIGLIKYLFNGKYHTYYPDFYIKSINTIIEVKSKYTYELHEEKNLAKEQSCLQQGFNFKFEIL